MFSFSDFYHKKLTFFSFSRTQRYISSLESIYIYLYYPIYIYITTFLYIPYLYILYSLSSIAAKLKNYIQQIILACISLMILCCWKLFLLSWERRIFTCVKSITKIQKPIQKFISNSSQKLLSEHSFQKIFNNYYQRNHSEHFLETNIR